jgi:hypothetical protein
MGENTHNEGGPMWDVNAAGGLGGWIYSSSRRTPASHSYSPPMNDTQVSAVLAAADNTDAQWLNAHPGPVKTWLQNRTATQRAAHKAGCLKTANL